MNTSANVTGLQPERCPLRIPPGTPRDDLHSDGPSLDVHTTSSSPRDRTMIPTNSRGVCTNAETFGCRGLLFATRHGYRRRGAGSRRSGFRLLTIRWRPVGRERSCLASDAAPVATRRLCVASEHPSMMSAVSARAMYSTRQQVRPEPASPRSTGMVARRNRRRPGAAEPLAPCRRSHRPNDEKETLKSEELGSPRLVARGSTWNTGGGLTEGHVQ